MALQAFMLAFLLLARRRSRSLGVDIRGGLWSSGLVRLWFYLGTLARNVPMVLVGSEEIFPNV